jgi:hypothetical protein
MPTKRLAMRQIYRLMGLHFGARLGARAIGRELGISHSTVREYLARIGAANIAWPLSPEITEAELEQRLFADGGVQAGARFHPGINVLKLCIAIPVVAPFLGLAIGLQAEPHVPQETSHRLVGDGVIFGLQRFRQVPLAGSDPQEIHPRIAAYRRLDKLQQRFHQPRLFHYRLFTTPSGAADAILRRCGIIAR